MRVETRHDTIFLEWCSYNPQFGIGYSDLCVIHVIKTLISITMIKTLLPQLNRHSTALSVVYQLVGWSVGRFVITLPFVEAASHFRVCHTTQESVNKFEEESDEQNENETKTTCWRIYDCR